MKPTADLVGQRFGRWLVKSRAPNRSRKPFWLCQCDCGVESVVGAKNLREGRSRSCGCWSRTRTTGDYKRTLEYRSWYNAVRRCHSSARSGFHRYGGRGIRVCDEWRHDFWAFLEHVGPCPGPGYSLDRIDNDGHYEPGNVRWATAAEQAGQSLRYQTPLPRRQAVW